uniref:Uncharacterized protein n=2 Tax=Schistocephalus solidus TaxID=70667 RepID=A0A0X3NQS9_SCHSO
MHKCESVSSQIIVKQQLESHYKRLQSVKPRVDDSLPYSFYNNPKFRAKFNPKRTSLRSLRPSNTEHRHLPTPVRPYASDSFVDGIVQRMLKDENFVSGQSPQWLKINSSRQRSADHQVRNTSPRSRTESNRSCSSARSRVVREQSADVFERNPQKFTPAKAFTPRTLKSSATSFIRNLECYNPPIRRRSSRASPRGSPVQDQEKILLTRSVSVPRGNVNSTRKHDRMVPVPTNRSSSSVACQASENCLPDTSSSCLRSTVVGQSAEPVVEKPPGLNLSIADQCPPSEPENMEEELEFLNFLSNVTSDILRRSSYTNEQICVIFRRHLADRTSALPLAFRRRALHQIVQQLSLPPEVARVIGESPGMGDRISSDTGSCVDHVPRHNVSSQSSPMAPDSMMVNVSQTEGRDVTATLKTTSSSEHRQRTRDMEGVLSSALQATNLGQRPLNQEIIDAEALDCDYQCRPLQSRPRSGDLLSDKRDDKTAVRTPERPDLSTPLTEVTALNCEVSESSRLTNEDSSCSEVSHGTELEPSGENFKDDVFEEEKHRR